MTSNKFLSAYQRRLNNNEFWFLYFEVDKTILRNKLQQMHYKYASRRLIERIKNERDFIR